MLLAVKCYILPTFSKFNVEERAKSQSAQDHKNGINLEYPFYIAKMKKNRTSSSADMVRLHVNVQFQVKSLSTGKSSSQTKKKFPKNSCIDTPKACAKFSRLQQKYLLIYVNVRFQVKPLCTGTSSSQRKNPQKFFKWCTQSVCQI